MARIYHVSGYIVDPDNSYTGTSEDFENLVEKSYTFRCCLTHQIHVRNSNAFEWRDDDPLNFANCDLKDIEKHFGHDENGADRSSEVVVGGVYRHFKGKDVKVLAVARDTEFGSLSVVYEYPETHSVWSRPLDMFLSDVDREKYPDVEQTKRFELIDPKGLVI